MPNKHFTIEKTGGIWWLKSPSGQRMFYPSVQCVGPKHGSAVPGAPVFDGIKSCGGSLGKWLIQTEERIRSWGFKGLGAWNDGIFHRTSLPFTESLNIFKSWQGLKTVFDADWEKTVDGFVKPQIEKGRRNQNLVGWFLDNEIPWNIGWMFDYFNGKKRDNPGRRAVVAFLRGKYHSISALNRAWGTSLSGWKALEKSAKLPVSRDVAHADMNGFLGLVADRFFETTCRAVRKYDPKRLILGVRYAGLPLPVVAAAQKNRTDVMSMNLYIPEAIFPVKDTYEAHVLSGGQPVWVTEFSFHSPYNNRSGDRNTIGFGARVREQATRGKCYTQFVSQMAALPYVIGCDWFQWPDESPMGRGGDGEDVNFGIVDIHNRPYEDLTRAMRRTNLAVDRIHARTGKWKYVPKPAPDVPAISLGSLEARPVPGSRAAATVGTLLPGLKYRPSQDPMPAKIPVAVRAGWRAEGLWVSFTAKDPVRTVEIEKTKKMIEWFWMTNFAEVFIRPGGEDHKFFDAKSVKIWAVPDGTGKNRPFVGALISHKTVLGRATGATVKQVRIPGGYRMDFWIPAKIIQVGPLKPWQVLRFNILADDNDRVQEVCWSAHQGDWTTQRPNTWGRMVLVP